MKSIKIKLLTFFASFLLIASIKLQAAEGFSIMTLNCYSFPNLPILRDLSSGIGQNIPTRIAKIGKFVTEQDPDIMVFQELWMRDNKKGMIKALGCTKDLPVIIPARFDCPGSPYPYMFLDVPNKKYETGLDSGLMIASKFPIEWADKIVYTDKEEEEKSANKGALFIRITDHTKKPVFIVDTHFQSGTGLSAITIRKKQAAQLGAKLAQSIKDFLEENPTKKDYRILVLGDFNEPTKYIDTQKMLTERQTYIVNAINEELENAGLKKVSLKQELNTLIKGLSAYHIEVQKILEVNELGRNGIIRSIDGKVLEELGPNARLVQGLRGGDIAEGGYWPLSSDGGSGGGRQLLDHLLPDEDSKILHYKNFAQEVLGRQGPDMPWNPATALSDHAAIWAEIGD
jgi:endonuclease/exonuclease/phosphatase family metal-dependent hydrolase